jgi:hypothetical protein
VATGKCVSGRVWEWQVALLNSWHGTHVYRAQRSTDATTLQARAPAAHLLLASVHDGGEALVCCQQRAGLHGGVASDLGQGQGQRHLGLIDGGQQLLGSLPEEGHHRVVHGRDSLHSPAGSAQYTGVAVCLWAWLGWTWQNICATG